MKIYAARDAGGSLYLYFNKKPVKHMYYWFSNGDYCMITEDLPSVRWEDNEPTEVEYDKLTHKLKLK